MRSRGVFLDYPRMQSPGVPASREALVDVLKVMSSLRVVVQLRCPFLVDGATSSKAGRFDEDLHHLLRSEEHTSELQSRENLVCRLLLEKKIDNDERWGTGLSSSDRDKRL